ncbi:hypothetical protein D3C81_1775200 [compost metagenome]
MQVIIVDVEFRLERLALLAVARLDGFAELKRRVGRRQHRRRVGADHVQVGLGQGGDVIAMINDGVVQVAVFEVGVANVDSCQDHFVFP